MRDLTIDAEFEAVLRPLSERELAQLRENLDADRVCHAPIVVWQGTDIIVDGMHRYRLCRELKVPFEVKELRFADRLEVKQWIRRTQGGRRNVDPDQLALLLGEEYEREKAAVPNPEGKNQHSAPAEVDGHADHQPTAAERVAARNGVSEATVRRAARTLKAARTVAENIGTTPAEVVAKVGRVEVENVAELPAAEQPAAVAKGKPKREKRLPDTPDAPRGLNSTFVARLASVVAELLYLKAGQWGDQGLVSLNEEQLAEQFTILDVLLDAAAEAGLKAHPDLALLRSEPQARRYYDGVDRWFKLARLTNRWATALSGEPEE